MGINDIKELIRGFCEDEDLAYREDYSGRGMYGKTCVGITCDRPLSVLVSIFAYIMESNDELSGDEVKHILGEPYEEAMGTRHILYFPSLKME